MRPRELDREAEALAYRDPHVVDRVMLPQSLFGGGEAQMREGEGRHKSLEVGLE